ncbi:hypothetical protein TOPH_05401 [Tolypocladium ophioglossoides CBS 100239]|uniref:Uncharacterized protein n=1 Tax=Tolypocladium ophioglossoides (strain CBS 100239) TaxID=1163406 RepID=A0A0L0N7R1_TOLOC|nr:hypothetical protein TOPH_05401 [Tolypocladium ophioglossoides CBS 100239]
MTRRLLLIRPSTVSSLPIRVVTPVSPPPGSVSAQVLCCRRPVRLNEASLQQAQTSSSTRWLRIIAIVFIDKEPSIPAATQGPRPPSPRAPVEPADAPLESAARSAALSACVVGLSAVQQSCPRLSRLPLAIPFGAPPLIYAKFWILGGDPTDDSLNSMITFHALIVRPLVPRCAHRALSTRRRNASAARGSVGAGSGSGSGPGSGSGFGRAVLGRLWLRQVQQVLILMR